MRRSRGVRVAYGVAALAVLALSFLWFSTITYTCPDTVGMTYSDCHGQGGVEMVTRTIVAAIGLCFAAWLASRALRRTTRPR